jgi:hypothetical protein
MTKTFIKGLFSSLFVATLLLDSSSAFSKGREMHKWGLGFGILSDPVPSFVSYQLKYNLKPWLQLMGSYGGISSSVPGTTPGTSISSSVHTFGAAAKVFVIPSWDLSPYVGAAYSYSKVSGAFSLSGSTIDSSSGNLSVIVASVGIDHQAGIGFNIGAGINYVLSPSVLSNVLSMIPNFYMAWFF